MGGNLCSCHRPPPKYRAVSNDDIGKAISCDNMMRLNGLGPQPYTPFKNGGFSSPIAMSSATSMSTPHLLSSSPAYGGTSPSATPEMIPEASATPSPTSSYSQLISASQENITYLNTSMPSTPASTLLRRKPPPKPPRMRSNYQSSGSFDGTLSPSSVRSFKGRGAPSLKTSFAEVTSTLDASICTSLDGEPTVTKTKKQQMKEKVFEIMTQTKEFLLLEVNPAVLLEYIRDKGVITENSFRELKKENKETMCDMLLDLIMSKGRAEFLIFCESLRAVNQTRIADLLSVLDTLIETITVGDIYSPDDSPEVNDNGMTTTTNPSCELCSSSDNNNKDEDMYDSSYFDINISFYDVESRNAKTINDVLVLKRQRKESLCDLVKGMKSKSERFVPMVSLSLYNQCLCGRGVDKLADILQNHSCVQELSIAKNHLGVDGMAQLGRALQQNRSLVKLDIRLNVIGDQGASHLSGGLRENTSLRSLNITSTGLSGQGCNNLVQGLGKNQSLVELDVGFNDLQDEGTEAISNVLANNSSLKRLRMRGNSILSRGSSNIFRALRKNCRLAALDMSSNKIGNESISALGETLLLNRTLREINLENCDISKEGCVSLARSLKTNNILKILDLSINPLLDGGAEALSDGLKYNQGLEVMSLNQCGVGNTGFMSLLESLKSNSTMTVLKLCYNKIGHDVNGGMNVTTSDPSAVSIDDVYETLCRTLQLNQDLKVLLWGNKLDDADSEPIYVNQEALVLPKTTEPDYVNLQSLATEVKPDDVDKADCNLVSQSSFSFASDSGVHENADSTFQSECISDSQSRTNALMLFDNSVWNETIIVNGNDDVVVNGRPRNMSDSAPWTNAPTLDKPPRSFSTDGVNLSVGNNTPHTVNKETCPNSNSNSKIETIV